MYVNLQIVLSLYINKAASPLKKYIKGNFSYKFNSLRLLEAASRRDMRRQK
jgi:hypothetical protein